MREPSASSTLRGVRSTTSACVRSASPIFETSSSTTRRGSTWASSARSQPPRQSDAMPGSSARHASPSSHSPWCTPVSPSNDSTSDPQRVYPVLSSSPANAGHDSDEARASAVKPGVSGSGPSTPAAARVAPHPAVPRSRTQTRSPRCWARHADASPMMPPPTIAASYRSTRRTIVSPRERHGQTRPPGALAALSHPRGATARGRPFGVARRGLTRRCRCRTAPREGVAR